VVDATPGIQNMKSDIEIIVEAFAKARHNHELHGLAAAEAANQIEKLVVACSRKSGQGYKIRSILFSLFNGKPADLSNTLCLDYELKVALCSVALGFGHRDFFYDEVKTAFVKHGLFNWFLEESDSE